MKNKKPATPGTPTAPAITYYPVQVGGIIRQCECGTIVRRGMMWEHNGTLYCSKLCVDNNRNTPEA